MKTFAKIFVFAKNVCENFRKNEFFCKKFCRKDNFCKNKNFCETKRAHFRLIFAFCKNEKTRFRFNPTCSSGFIARKYKQRKEYIKNICKTNFQLGAMTMKRK
jgi:hypothetical protein